MNIDPKVTIIIPVLNNLVRLKKSIGSIKKQSFLNFEVWIVDGGSSAKTLQFLSNLKAPFNYFSSKDKGIYDAMNKGVQLAKGQWIYFLGAGDVLYNDSVLENVFKKNDVVNYPLIAGKIIYEGEDKPFAYSKTKKLKNSHWSNRMWIINTLHHQATFYEKGLFKKKEYNLKYNILSDYHFNLQLLKDKKKCQIVNMIIAKCNSDGISKNGSWSIYKEEIDLKTELSSILFRPFFYIIAFLKFSSRKIVNDE